ncbi:hypothetical protein BpHYR1_017811 [Brachionus plicatilis]|uniref:Uncharacterized protein n=1 Tax=Brachionus plicatilis TaxID=10195 RepID=A0A3M7RMB5_BRAPC|nr:hypothetical protein BpHYR1_017811 [Brachionus plicatilis]
MFIDFVLVLAECEKKNSLELSISLFFSLRRQNSKLKGNFLLKDVLPLSNKKVGKLENFSKLKNFIFKLLKKDYNTANYILSYSADLKSGFFILVPINLFIFYQNNVSNPLVKLLDQLYLEQKVQNIFLNLFFKTQSVTLIIQFIKN